MKSLSSSTSTTTSSSTSTTTTSTTTTTATTKTPAVENQLRKAHDCFQLGFTYYQSQQYNQSIQQLQQAASIRSRQIGTHHVSTGYAYLSMGWVYFQQQQQQQNKQDFNFNQAEEEYHHALYLFRRAWNIFLHHHHYDSSISYLIDEARFGMHQCLIKFYGFSKSAAETYCNTLHQTLEHVVIGNHLMKIQNFQDNAMDSYRHALLYLEDDALGIETLSLEAADVYCQVAKIQIHHVEQHYHDVAIMYYSKAYNIYCTILGPTHYDTLTTFQKLKSLQESMDSLSIWQSISTTIMTCCFFFDKPNNMML